MDKVIIVNVKDFTTEESREKVFYKCQLNAHIKAGRPHRLWETPTEHECVEGYECDIEGKIFHCECNLGSEECESNKAVFYDCELMAHRKTGQNHLSWTKKEQKIEEHECIEGYACLSSTREKTFYCECGCRTEKAFYNCQLDAHQKAGRPHLSWKKELPPVDDECYVEENEEDLVELNEDEEEIEDWIKPFATSGKISVMSTPYKSEDMFRSFAEMEYATEFGEDKKENDNMNRKIYGMKTLYCVKDGSELIVSGLFGVFWMCPVCRSQYNKDGTSIGIPMRARIRLPKYFESRQWLGHPSMREEKRKTKMNDSVGTVLLFSIIMGLIVTGFFELEKFLYLTGSRWWLSIITLVILALFIVWIWLSYDTLIEPIDSEDSLSTVGEKYFLIYYFKRLSFIGFLILLVVTTDKIIGVVT